MIKTKDVHIRMDERAMVQKRRRTLCEYRRRWGPTLTVVIKGVRSEGMFT